MGEDGVSEKSDESGFSSTLLKSTKTEHSSHFVLKPQKVEIQNKV